jgi:Ca2+-binding EF-hand superfamily protein
MEAPTLDLREVRAQRARRETEPKATPLPDASAAAPALALVAPAPCPAPASAPPEASSEAQEPAGFSGEPAEGQLQRPSGRKQTKVEKALSARIRDSLKQTDADIARDGLRESVGSNSILKQLASASMSGLSSRRKRGPREPSFLATLIRETIDATHTRAMDLFRNWDDDGDGTINQAELRRGLESIGVIATKDEVELLFALVDKDGSGDISYRELFDALRDRSQRAPEMEPGAKGEIALMTGQQKVRDAAVAAKARAEAKLKVQRSAKETEKLAAATLRGLRSPSKSDLLAGSPPGSPGSPEAAGVPDSLKRVRDALNAKKERMLDLFRQWDTDGNGEIDKGEMRRGLESIGLSASREEVDGLFALVDKDGSGDISYRELFDALRDRSQLSAEMQPGALGQLRLMPGLQQARDDAAAAREAAAEKATATARRHAEYNNRLLGLLQQSGPGDYADVFQGGSRARAEPAHPPAPPFARVAWRSRVAAE